MVDSSVFISGGQLNQALGYDQRLLYHPLRDMEAPRVGPRPSLTEVDQAKGLSNDDVLVDLRLVDDAKRAHAVALFLLPFVRALIDAGGLAPREQAVVGQDHTFQPMKFAANGLGLTPDRIDRDAIEALLALQSVQKLVVG